MRPTCLLLGIACVLLPLTFPSAQAVPCGRELHVHRTVIDPVTETRYDYDDSAGYCNVTQTSISCEVTPLVEMGNVHYHGYRSGVYLYQCDTAEGIHAQNSFSPPVCQHVPYLAVGGTKIPGTDQTYCAGDILDVDTPAVIPAIGVLIVHPDGDHNWVDAMYWVPDCIFTHDVSGIPIGYVEAEGQRVEYHSC